MGKRGPEVKTGGVTSSIVFFNDTATTEIYTLSLHDALPILLEQLLKAGIRGPWKFAKAGRGRAGASRQQGSKAEGSEQPQASDHVVFLILDQMSGEVYPSTGRGAMLATIKPEFRCVLYVVAVKLYPLGVLRPAGWVRS